MTQPIKKSVTPYRAWEASAANQVPVSLEARFRTGDGYFFSYAYLVCCRYDKGDTIELHFSTWVLRIEGRNLGALYDALSKHTVSFVHEGDQDDGSVPEADPFIVQLTVEEADD